LLKDSKTNIFKQGEVANFIIELSNRTMSSDILLDILPDSYVHDFIIRLFPKFSKKLFNFILNS
ncbi:hypothetical protein GPU72_09595, partial [Streptococcus thermophilus]|nr:hypothetical protein [Streptococcus thermophilus]